MLKRLYKFCNWRRYIVVLSLYVLLLWNYLVIVSAWSMVSFVNWRIHRNSRLLLRFYTMGMVYLMCLRRSWVWLWNKSLILIMLFQTCCFSFKRRSFRRIIIQIPQVRHGTSSSFVVSVIFCDWFVSYVPLISVKFGGWWLRIYGCWSLN